MEKLKFQEPFSFDEICRTCLETKSDSLQRIFNSEISINDNNDKEYKEPISTSEMLVTVSSLKILPEDDLPKGICNECLESLEKAYNFRKMCIRSDLTIQTMKLQNRIQIHSENDDDSQPSPKEDIEDKSVNESNDNSNAPVYEVLKSTGTCDDNETTQSYVGNKSRIKEEKSESNSDSVDKHEIILDESIISVNQESYLTLKKEILTDPKIEKPNPRNKRNGCFICEDCGKSFDRQHRLHRHLSVHKKEGRPFECEHCKRRFAQEGHLRRHAITHDTTFLEHTELKKCIDGHQCPECPRKFLKQVSLASHMRTHRQKIDMYKPYQCEECLKIFEGVHRLNRHKKLHEENHQYVCDTCGQTFGTRSHLIDHLSKHNGIKPHICHFCAKSFQQAGTLKDHLRTHTGEQPFLCSECGKAFKSASNLRQHQLRHTGVKSYQCSECPSKFTLKSDLSKHASTHGNEKPYTCEICGSRFTKNSSLTKHKIIHTGEKPHQCDCCKMRFISSNHMKRHMRTHTGEKPYACKYCDRKFAQSNDMIKHLRSHVGANVYKCEECDASFRLNTELKKHIAEHYQAQLKNNGKVDEIPAELLQAAPTSSSELHPLIKKA
ncbi:zinc finger protein 883-like [Eupeodes corollae]|uniref:zinc finger protein 883-like n=1 Tax=Eupeodes corollae TaxID=290404 RepID=UPI002493C032|nr:zinc finger protein 883-like [Eupeodes corollae]